MRIVITNFQKVKSTFFHLKYNSDAAFTILHPAADVGGESCVLYILPHIRLQTNHEQSKHFRLSRHTHYNRPYIRQMSLRFHLLLYHRHDRKSGYSPPTPVFPLHPKLQDHNLYICIFPMEQQFLFLKYGCPYHH